MTTDEVGRALAVLGLDSDDLPAEVLDGLRTAATKPPKQLTRDDLARMSPEAITEAERAGKLDKLLGRQGA